MSLSISGVGDEGCGDGVVLGLLLIKRGTERERGRSRGLSQTPHHGGATEH